MTDEEIQKGPHLVLSILCVKPPSGISRPWKTSAELEYRTDFSRFAGYVLCFEPILSSQRSLINVTRSLTGAYQIPFAARPRAAWGISYRFC